MVAHMRVVAPDRATEVVVVFVEAEVGAPDAPRQGLLHRIRPPHKAEQGAQNAGRNADTLQRELEAAGHSADKLSRYSSFQ